MYVTNATRYYEETALVEFRLNQRIPYDLTCIKAVKSCLIIWIEQSVGCVCVFGQ